MDYDELVDFFKEKGINEGGYCWRYNELSQGKYDILHQRKILKRYIGNNNKSKSLF